MGFAPSEDSDQTARIPPSLISFRCAFNWLLRAISMHIVKTD